MPYPYHTYRPVYTTNPFRVTLPAYVYMNPSLIRNDNIINSDNVHHQTTRTFNNYSPHLQHLFSIIIRNVPLLRNTLNNLSFAEGNEYIATVEESGSLTLNIINRNNHVITELNHNFANSIATFRAEVNAFLISQGASDVSMFGRLTSISIGERLCMYYIDRGSYGLEIHYHSFADGTSRIDQISNFRNEFSLESHENESIYYPINLANPNEINYASRESFFGNRENIMSSHIKTQIKQAIKVLTNNDSMGTFFRKSLQKNMNTIATIRDAESEELRNTICNDVIRKHLDSILIVEELFNLEESCIYGITPYEAAQLVTSYENYSSELLRLAIEESKESCLEGKVARIINSLSGVHPDINIVLSPQQHANELAIVYRKKNAPIEELIARMEEEKISKEIIDVIVENY